jgi:hypothetical protein
MDSNIKFSTLVSLVIHSILLIIILLISPDNIILPSRSNGITVNLIDSSNLPPLKVEQKISKAQYHVSNISNPDIKLNIPNKQYHKKALPPLHYTAKIKTPPKNINHEKIKIIRTQRTDNLLNNLINNLHQSIATTANHNQGVATGGTSQGSSDTNSLVVNYADSVVAAVRPWVIIPDGIDPNTVVILQVVLLPNMSVYSVKIIQPSNNNTYDTNVVNAINRVHIFPELPENAKFSDFRQLMLIFKPQSK